MAQVKTLAGLQDELDKEIGWRNKEVRAFIVASKRNGPDSKFFIRAGVALLYAHWEGFIKASSELYLDFIHNQRLSYSELKSCFAVFGLKSKLQLLTKSRQSQLNVELFEFIRDGLGGQANLQLSSAIDTESNLTSAVFKNIALSLGIDCSRYETKFNLIDESLVKRRNMIAHGEYLSLQGREFGDLVNTVLQMMTDYQTDLLNAAAQGHYKQSRVA